MLSSSDTLVKPTIPHREKHESQKAHIVADPKWEGNIQAIVTEARVMGYELEALCGTMFIPSRDPEGLPVCQMCLELAANLKK